MGSSLEFHGFERRHTAKSSSLSTYGNVAIFKMQLFGPGILPSRFVMRLSEGIFICLPFLVPKAHANIELRFSEDNF